MRGSVDTVKERLDIVELVSEYVKLEKAGSSFKARCPFHNEKTPSFFVSPSRQSFYCFGCGAKGDAFTFVEEMEGLDFRGALDLLAQRTGVEIEYRKDESRAEKDKLLDILELATQFFEKEFENNREARRYVLSRGIDEDSLKKWRIGYAPAEWRSILSHFESLGIERTDLTKAGLIKMGDADSGKEPYDVFRDRIIFPISDWNGKIVGFSGRALGKETEPKYLNSPDSILFHKNELLYGLDKAKESIRRQDYAVLVEGQMDLVLSHQAGVSNTVASSGTAFTEAHLERIRRLSSRVILAFDGDSAGRKAAEKALILALSLGFEVKISRLPENLDPADIAALDSSKWREILRSALPSIEHFLNLCLEEEKNGHKLGKRIEKEILPLVKLIGSAIEQSHFISMIAKRAGLKEEVLWEDLRKTKALEIHSRANQDSRETTDPTKSSEHVPEVSYRERIETRLNEVRAWRKELPESDPALVELGKEEAELEANLDGIVLRDELNKLSLELSRAEAAREESRAQDLVQRIQKLHSEIRILEEKKRAL